MNKVRIYVNEEPYEIEMMDNGAYGTIFKPKNEEFVYKVFKKKGTSDYCNFLAENTFRSEILAYKRLMESENLKNHIPHFYGAVKIDKVEINGENVSENHRCDLAYKIQYINLKFTKIGCSLEVKPFIEPFREIGINYLEDADYCHNGEHYKFIDFGVLGVLEELEDRFYSQRFTDLEATKKEFYELHPYLAPTSET